MSAAPALSCPGCGTPAFADDVYCEACGRHLVDPADHAEVDADTAAAVCHRGLVHHRNEDAFFVVTTPRGPVLVVCDGVSSATAPHVAARVGAHAAGQALVAGADPAAALVAADAAVRDLRWQATTGRDAPSCTAVAARWDGDAITIAWAGDSRAYWVDADGAACLTVDHSWANEQGVALEPDDPRAHIITRWLGPDAPDVPFDVVSMTPSGPGHLVLCSDGLSNHVDAAELGPLAATAAGPIDLARRLLTVALERGGTDNVTVAVADVDPAHG